MMSELLDLLMRHRMAVIFAWSFGVQGGAPIPAVPMLLGAGALAGAGQMTLMLAVATAVAAALAADVLWYILGLFVGARVLGFLGRLSLDPDSFVRDAKERFQANRARFLVLAKFLPGVNPLAAALAGVVALRPLPFLSFVILGALLWAGGWMTLGYICSNVIELVAAQVARVGTPVGLALVTALMAYLAFKLARRQRFLRHLRKTRITPQELMRRLEAGDPLVIVDLRTALDIETVPYRIPGARQIAPELLLHPPAQPLISRDREVVFYCAEPQEATSAWIALRLGFKNTHPLSGGLEGWREAGFPVEPIMLGTQSSLSGFSSPDDAANLAAAPTDT
jgi:membrane protein DedA with SNARE-associated domain/rhodanese-related sulfurtransferase